MRALSSIAGVDFASGLAAGTLSRGAGSQPEEKERGESERPSVAGVAAGRRRLLTPSVGSPPATRQAACRLTLGRSQFSSVQSVGVEGGRPAVYGRNAPFSWETNLIRVLARYRQGQAWEEGGKADNLLTDGQTG